MCRLAIFPGGTSRKEALAVLDNMVGTNLDGTGEAYIEDGKFIVNKYGYSLYKVLRKGKPFLNNLQSRKGITICHLRAKSIGQVSKENAHPYISLNGRIASMHNGTVPRSEIRLLLAYLQSCEGFNSSTDSSAAGEVISRISMKNFIDIVDFCGVFVSLNINGSLDIGKTNGDLALHLKEDGTCLIASELDDDKYKKTIEMSRGWFKFDNNLRYITHKTKSYSWQGGGEYADWYSRGEEDESRPFKHVYTGKHESSRIFNSGHGVSAMEGYHFQD